MQTNHAHFLDLPQLPGGTTRFWLIRHALVDRVARQRLYGALDVPLCAESLISQAPLYRTLARRLPQGADWITSPLSRARHTAETIFAAGYGDRPLEVEPGMIEQSMGDWHDLPHDSLASQLTIPAHRFWSTSAAERPPGGESMLDVCARVGATLERLADRQEGRDTVIVSHGGAIRAALAHALRIHAETALYFSIQNLSVTILERIDGTWRAVAVNEMPLGLEEMN